MNGNSITSKAEKGRNQVFFISVAISLAITLWGVISSSSLEKAGSWLFDFITVKFGWLFLLVVSFFVFFCIFLAFSKYGKIVLGPDGSKPEFSNFSWFAMLFSAGMGIGLIFWSAAEPLNFYTAPPPGIVAGTPEAAFFAIQAAILHWGLHPWACFAVIGLGIAYFQFRKGKPGLISTLFIPLLGEKRVAGPLGKAIDIFAALATILGVGTSLGLGTMQINGGLNHLFGLPENNITWLVIIVVLAVVYIGTAVSGVGKGIKLLGDINMRLCVALMVLSFILGPTLTILNNAVGTAGAYVNDVIKDSMGLNGFGDNSWMTGWRVFYWAWWISWAPFCGTFIARISRGRTVREFVLAVMFVPTLVAVLWFSIFGSMGIAAESQVGFAGLQEMAANTNTALFTTFSHYPLGMVLSIIAVVLVLTFFCTSANSATFVLGMLSDHGKLNPDKRKLFIWGVLEAGLAYSLMLSGGIASLQTASIAAASPFIFVMLACCVSLVKAFREDVPTPLAEAEGEEKIAAAPSA